MTQRFVSNLGLLFWCVSCCYHCVMMGHTSDSVYCSSEGNKGRSPLTLSERISCSWANYRHFFILFLHSARPGCTNIDSPCDRVMPGFLTKQTFPPFRSQVCFQERQSSCLSGNAVLPGCLLANSEWSCGKLSDILSGSSCGRRGICCQMHQEGRTLINSLSCLHT